MSKPKVGLPSAYVIFSIILWIAVAVLEAVVKANYVVTPALVIGVIVQFLMYYFNVNPSPSRPKLSFPQFAISAATITVIVGAIVLFLELWLQAGLVVTVPTLIVITLTVLVYVANALNIPIPTTVKQT
jgi:hypothetical protein